MLVSIYENEKYRRLNENNIVIEDIFLNSKGERLVRSTDGFMNDLIINKRRIEKRYFINNECIKVEKQFNEKFRYTFYNFNNPNEVINCPNCAHNGKVLEFLDGCPYCKTNFNVGLNNKNIFKKDILQRFIYKESIILLIIFFLLSFILLSFDTFNKFIVSFFLTLVFSPSIFIVVSAIKNKNGLNYNDFRKSVLKLDCDENNFYSNLYIGLLECFYNVNNLVEQNLIDFDILRCTSLNFGKNNNNEIFVQIGLEIRKIYFENEKIVSKMSFYEIKMKRNENFVSDGSNYKVINCLCCGASIDVTSKQCVYCGQFTNFSNEWIIETINEIKN